MLNELIPRSTMVDGVSSKHYSVLWCKPTLSFVWSRLSAPVQLSTRYTTADIVLEIDSTSVTVA